MKEFPPELIYVLIFVGIYLIQYLMKRRGGQAPRESSQDGPVPQPSDESTPDLAGLEWGTPTGGSPLRALGDELGPPEASAAPRAHPRPQSRFSRQSLMGTRREVQNAVVIATIMGPCRALEPPGGDPDASRRRAAR